MKQDSVQLDARRRCVVVGGRSTVLQEKCWQVLSVLQTRAPEIVCRSKIIESVWEGNFATGEKGLNQAVWAIRTALDDDPRSPRYIRTMPRRGYQWVGPCISSGVPREAKRVWTRVSTALGVTALIAVSIVASESAKDDSSAGITWSAMPDGLAATRAYLVGHDVHVEFADGRRGVIINSNDAKISDPVLSSDGAGIAVTVNDDNDCRMVTIDLTNGERQDFSACPSPII